MPRFDIIKRAKARMTILRGWDPQNPKTRTASHRVQDGVTVLSGQIISKVVASDGVTLEWVLGVGGTSLDGVFIAQDDWDETNDVDESVLESGKLVGLDCSGQFEVETAYYKANETYNDGTLLTYDGVTGDVKPITANDGTEVIIGRVTRNIGVKSLAGENSGVTNLNVIDWVTEYHPAVNAV